MRANVKILPTPDQVAQSAAAEFIRVVEDAVQHRGICSVVLSGGSTPQSLYRLLANEPYSEQVDWSRLHIFWGDERCVPPDHPDNNAFRARRALLEHVPIPAENIHRVPTDLPPEQAAAAYEEDLLQFFSTLPDQVDRTQARFDLVLLGMGDDGHTASLFPGSDPVLEYTRWVAALYVDKLAAWRVTLTPAILNRAAHVIFLVSGGGKSWTLQKVIYGSYQPDRYPAQVIQPHDGQVMWLVDEAAASLF